MFNVIILGDINVIAAIGDSLTAASGASSKSFADLFVENRGLAWSIGGQWNWRNATTLPNILKEFNPKVIKKELKFGKFMTLNWTFLTLSLSLSISRSSSLDIP